jgi:hypothetical protein
MITEMAIISPFCGGLVQNLRLQNLLSFASLNLFRDVAGGYSMSLLGKMMSIYIRVYIKSRRKPPVTPSFPDFLLPSDCTPAGCPSGGVAGGPNPTSGTSGKYVTHIDTQNGRDLHAEN